MTRRPVLQFAGKPGIVVARLKVIGTRGALTTVLQDGHVAVLIVAVGPFGLYLAVGAPLLAGAASLPAKHRDV